MGLVGSLWALANQKNPRGICISLKHINEPVIPIWQRLVGSIYFIFSRFHLGAAPDSLPLASCQAHEEPRHFARPIDRLNIRSQSTPPS